MARIDARYLQRDPRRLSRGASRPWNAQVRFDGTLHQLGSYATQEEAERLQCQFLEEMHYGDPPTSQAHAACVRRTHARRRAR